MMKNITLSAPDEIIERARIYAKSHNTTLNQLMRDYLKKCIDQFEREAAAEEFLRLTELCSCRPEEGWRFNREEIYRRGKQDE
jgi:hypothetical protein